MSNDTRSAAHNAWYRVFSCLPLLHYPADFLPKLEMPARATACIGGLRRVAAARGIDAASLRESLPLRLTESFGGGVERGVAFLRPRKVKSAFVQTSPRRLP